MKTKTFNLYSLWETKEEKNQNELDQQIVEKNKNPQTLFVFGLLGH